MELKTQSLELYICMQCILSRYQNVGQQQLVEWWRISVGGTISRITLQQTTGGDPYAFENTGLTIVARGSCFTSQVLSPTEEKQLATQLVKMGEKGKRLIFDRHFFTLVRISGVLTSNYSKQDSDLQLEHNFDWINFVREPVARLVSTWIQPWKLSNQVSMYHYLRKSSRWTSKKSRPPEVSFFLLQNQD